MHTYIHTYIHVDRQSAAKPLAPCPSFGSLRTRRLLDLPAPPSRSNAKGTAG